jgi:hypothetical protein
LIKNCNLRVDVPDIEAEWEEFNLHWTPEVVAAYQREEERALQAQEARTAEAQRQYNCK